MKLQVGVKALIKQDDTYLFLQRSKEFKDERCEWDIPGGRIEPEEALHNALVREVKEETSMVVLDIGVPLAAQDIFVEQKGMHVVRLTYTVTASGVPTISDEHESYKWFSLQDILAEPHVDSYLRQVLEEMS